MATANDYAAIATTIDNLIEELKGRCQTVARDWADLPLEGPKREQVNTQLGDGDVARYKAVAALEEARATARQREEACHEYYRKYSRWQAGDARQPEEPDRPWYCDRASLYF